MTQAAILAASGSPGTTTGFKNRIINGAMMINQRGFSGNLTAAATSLYTLDRWQGLFTLNDKVSVSQNAGSVTPPAGFINYLGATSLAATSVGAGDIFGVQQVIEGLNMADLAWGTANAKTITVSFWVRSSLTGSFGGVIQNSGASYNYPFTYTISSANTWEQKTITIAGPTSGTWLTTNGAGAFLFFGWGVGSTYGSGTAGAWTGSAVFVPSGSTSVVGTNGATWYVTGVQLEVGTTATNFDFRSISQELQLCQRYYEQINLGTSPSSTQNQYLGIGTAYASNDVRFVLYYQNKRSNPSVSLASYTIRFGTTNYGLNLTSLLVDGAGPTCTLIYNNSTTGFTEGRALQVVSQASTGTISISAEL